MNRNVKQRRAAARSGEWAQHFSNASCFIINSYTKYNKGYKGYDIANFISRQQHIGLTAKVHVSKTRSSAFAEGPHDALVSGNLATMNHPI